MTKQTRANKKKQKLSPAIGSIEVHLKAGHEQMMMESSQATRNKTINAKRKMKQEWVEELSRKEARSAGRKGGEETKGEGGRSRRKQTRLKSKRRRRQYASSRVVTIVFFFLLAAPSCANPNDDANALFSQNRHIGIVSFVRGGSFFCETQSVVLDFIVHVPGSIRLVVSGHVGGRGDAYVFVSTAQS